MIETGKQHAYRRLAAAVILRAVRDTRSDMPVIRENARAFLLSALNRDSWPRQLFYLAGINPTKTVGLLFGRQKMLH